MPLDRKMRRQIEPLAKDYPQANSAPGKEAIAGERRPSDNSHAMGRKPATLHDHFCSRLKQTCLSAMRRKRPLQSSPFGLGTQPSTAAVPREKRSLMQGAAIFWGWTAAVRTKRHFAAIAPASALKSFPLANSPKWRFDRCLAIGIKLGFYHGCSIDAHRLVRRKSFKYLDRRFVHRVVKFDLQIVQKQVLWCAELRDRCKHR
jgi:hypothetical protein